MTNHKWTNADLKAFQKQISEKKRKISDEMDVLKKRADEMLKSSTSNALYSSHMADASSDHVELEKAYYMIARNKKFLGYLDKALVMIKDFTFGICQQCNEIISKERLEEVPHTKKCFDCKSNR